MTEEQEIRNVWSGYWKSVDRVAPWDSLSELILRTVEAESGGLAGRTVLEAGCGTGRISHRLALAGARVTCLDITEEALELARTTFGEVPARFVQGSILDLPRDDGYDLVWNAGVIEHFCPADQRRALSEFLAVGKRAVVLTPYAHSLLYRFGKLVLERLGRWPYGREIPVLTLSPCLPEGARLVREYTVCFLPLLLDAHKFLPVLRPALELLQRGLLRGLGVAGLVRLDRALSRWLGGYLLVSVLERE